ncbi:DUF2806 domain-containing protein [Phenylobacterium sp.]|uniref:DUF2806 domain-containing protein n=1 Tax=Phenylobacterium sp. TaxID=1871053 RepID=UPI0025E59BF2|nr:DUF2806 domain-containing protein [Phenylobacterium sp.]
MAEAAGSGAQKGSLQTFMDEGGLTAAVLGKPIAAAIGRLIGAVADIPAAGVDNLAQRIRDDTEARSVVKRAIAQAAATRATADEALVDRAVQRWGYDRLRKQENVEAIAAETLLQLKEDPPKDPEGPAPSDDFMNFFQAHAENASSEDMRTLFARILAGECRAPGSFSLGALQVLSVMDKQLASAVQTVRPWVNNGDYVLFAGEFHKGDRLAPLLILEDFSLIRLGMLTKPLKLDDEGHGGLVYGRRAIILHGAPNAEIAMPAATLTPVGRQIMALCPEPTEVPDFDLIIAAAKKVMGIQKVQVGDFSHRSAEGQVFIANWRDT